MNLGTLIRETRQARGVSIRELTRRSGIHFDTIRSCELSLHGSNLYTVETLLSALGKPVRWGEDGLDFGTCLKETRKARGLSGPKLAKLAGIDPSNTCMYESGAKMPRLSTAAALCKVLDIKYTIGESDGRPNNKG